MTNIYIMRDDEKDYIFDNFAARLEVGMNMMKVNKSQLANAVGISRTAIYKYLNQEMNPDLGIIYKMSQILGVPFEFFTKNTFELNEYIYTWNEKNTLSKSPSIKRKEIQQQFPNTKSGKRMTDEQYPEETLREKRKVNRDSYNVILDTIDLLIHSVDETTKYEMIKVLWDSTNTLKLIKQDYDDYMNTKK